MNKMRAMRRMLQQCTPFPNSSEEGNEHRREEMFPTTGTNMMGDREWEQPEKLECVACDHVSKDKREHDYHAKAWHRVLNPCHVEGGTWGWKEHNADGYCERNDDDDSDDDDEVAQGFPRFGFLVQAP